MRHDRRDDYCVPLFSPKTLLTEIQYRLRLVLGRNTVFVAMQHKTSATQPFSSGSGAGGAGSAGGSGGPDGGPGGSLGGPGSSPSSLDGGSSGLGSPGEGGPGVGINLGGNPEGGGANGGLKGNMPTVFNRDHSKSDQFLHEFWILMLSNHGHHVMATPLDRIGVTLSYIRGKKVNDWVELTLNKVDHTLQQGVLLTYEALWEMFLRDFQLSFTDMTKI